MCFVFDSFSVPSSAANRTLCLYVNERYSTHHAQKIARDPLPNARVAAHSNRLSLYLIITSMSSGCTSAGAGR